MNDMNDTPVQFTRAKVMTATMDQEIDSDSRCVVFSLTRKLSHEQMVRLLKISSTGKKRS
ncbi:hypothetical protein [Methanolobus psychrotolerans]|uniref:hypothetical protein n=1 Tax=Methanolobus psychrotolerans TaxID=1874706 RepID=UPI000B919E26|nr:hypothetical protein [Methanolobus psychrotolerans]